ncbi:hypothetical protein [Ferruginibacter sp. HRS2-29]|uniref:hypothetical protein n=1 Tax=Ferruginibacter sp. HRS2-29 TaxID=2487334 RepID=UPI0020CDF45C|nr:hypothetical protein [Ferruginibacter sp. HRS2-29]
MEDFKGALPEKKKSGWKGFFWKFTFVIVLILGVFLWWQYWYVFGEGVKSGELNYLVKKGNVFKTYEGKLIQSGFRSKAAGTVQSYEFEFSVSNDSIATVLMNNSGKYFDLHYKEYKHTLPWRGYTVYIVDEIKNMKEINP